MDVVFLSHVAEDAALALRIAQGLEEAGYATWYYERDSLPGPSYLDQIVTALRHTSAVVVLVSPAALPSWQVDKEVVQAHDRGLPFLPLLHDVTYEQLRTARPAWGMAFGAAVALPLPTEDISSLLPQLVAGLRWLLSPPASAQGRAVPAPAPAPETELLNKVKRFKHEIELGVHLGGDVARKVEEVVGTWLDILIQLRLNPELLSALDQVGYDSDEAQALLDMGVTALNEPAFWTMIEELKRDPKLRRSAYAIIACPRCSSNFGVWFPLESMECYCDHCDQLMTVHYAGDCWIAEALP